MLLARISTNCATMTRQDGPVSPDVHECLHAPNKPGSDENSCPDLRKEPVGPTPEAIKCRDSQLTPFFSCFPSVRTNEHTLQLRCTLFVCPECVLHSSICFLSYPIDYTLVLLGDLGNHLPERHGNSDHMQSKIRLRMSPTKSRRGSAEASSE